MVPSSGVSKLLSSGCLPRASASWPSMRARLPLTATVKLPPRDWVMVTKVSDGIMISVPAGTRRASTSRLVRTTSRSCMFDQSYLCALRHREAFTTAAFSGGVGIAEAEQGVHTLGDKVDFDAVYQWQVFLLYEHIHAVDGKDTVIGFRCFYPLGFILEAGAATLFDGQANAFGFRFLVQLFANVFDRRWGHGHVHIAWGEDFGCHVSTSSGKQALDLLQAGKQFLDLFQRIVERKRSPGCTGYSVEIHQWHGAMVAGADGDALLVQQGADVARVQAGNLERHHRYLIGGGTDDLHAWHGFDQFISAVQQGILCCFHGLSVQRIQIVDGGAQTHCFGNSRGSGLEFVGQHIPGGSFE